MIITVLFSKKNAFKPSIPFIKSNSSKALGSNKRSRVYTIHFSVK